MKKYESLIKAKELKDEFIVQFASIFSTFNSDQLKEAFELDHSMLYNDWIRLNSYSDTRFHEAEKLARLTEEFKGKSLKRWENYGVNEIEYYLIDKVRSIILFKGDFAGAIRMLDSFRRGAKGLRSNVRGTEGYYYWEEKNGIEKCRHAKNLERAHFRWNYGERYTLSWDQIQKIDYFLYTFVL